MKVIRNMSILLGGLLLFLHTVFPHDHHNQQSSEEHFLEIGVATSIFDIIELAFHLDLGEDHLENFQVTPKTAFHLSPFIVDDLLNFELPAIIKLNDDSFPATLSEPFLEQSYRSEDRFRGPPQV